MPLRQDLLHAFPPADRETVKIFLPFFVPFNSTMFWEIVPVS